MPSHSHPHPSRAVPLKQALASWAMLVGGVTLSIAVLLRIPGRFVDGLPLRTWTAIPPFGRIEVVVVHLIAALAASWAVSRVLLSKFELGTRPTVLFCGALGGLSALGTLNFGTLTGLESAVADGNIRFWVRTFWAVGLVFPWCLAALRLLGEPDTTVPNSGVSDGKLPNRDVYSRQFWVTLLAAVLLPMAHVGHAARRESDQLAEYAVMERYMKAWEHAVALEAMAGDQEVGGRLPDESMFAVRKIGGRRSTDIRSDLVQRINTQIFTANQPLPQKPDIADTIRRAQVLMSLEYLDEAIELLEHSGHRRPDALLLLASIHEDKRDSALAIKVLEEAIDQIGDASGPDVVPVVRNIYQRLAQNLRLEQRYGEAETRLLEAVERFDHSDGLFYWELGMHCHQGGRFKSAIDYYKKCVAAEEGYRPQVERAIQELRVNTPACVIRSTYVTP